MRGGKEKMERLPYRRRSPPTPTVLECIELTVGYDEVATWQWQRRWMSCCCCCCCFIRRTTTMRCTDAAAHSTYWRSRVSPRWRRDEKCATTSSDVKGNAKSTCRRAHLLTTWQITLLLRCDTSAGRSIPCQSFRRRRTSQPPVASVIATRQLHVHLLGHKDVRGLDSSMDWIGLDWIGLDWVRWLLCTKLWRPMFFS